MFSCQNVRFASAITIAILSLSVGFSAQASEPLERQLNMQTHEFDRLRVQTAAERLWELGRQNLEVGNYDAAIAAWQQSMAQYVTLGDMTAAGRVGESLAKTFIYLERYDEAIGVLQQRLTIARDLNDLTTQIYTLNNLGTAYLQQNQLSDSQIVFVEALQIAKASDDRVGIGLSLSNLGLAATRAGELETAERYYEAAISHRLQASDNIGVAHSLNSLGQVYQQQGASEQALDTFLQAYEAAMESEYTDIRLTVLDNLIALYSDLADVAQLQKYVSDRVLYTDASAPPQQRIGLFVGLGQYYEQIGDWKRAQEAYQEALEITQQLRDPQLQAYLRDRLHVLSVLATE